jgi:hypothetical protein
MALPNINISVGSPPLLWSEVFKAFEKINDNFTSLDLATGGTAVNLGLLNSDIKPGSTQVYQLGDQLKRWKSVYTGEYSIDAGYELNGVWAGSAQIKGVGLTINLPANSTIGGDPLTGEGTNLIVDPFKTFFKSIQVDNNNTIEAPTFSSTLNLNSGESMQLIVDSASESITFNNTGVTNLSAGNGILVDSTTGDITVTNVGVRSLSNVSVLPLGRAEGTGININNAVGDAIKITNTGVISIVNGVGITISSDSATGEVQITNSAPAGNAFSRIEINGDNANRIQADAVNDILNITSGQGITLTKNTSTDTLTITVNPVFDLTGSVFGAGNTLIVDADENKIYAEFFGNVTGNITGNADSSTVASTVDITDTNGVATIFYPTFAENRTTGQTIRSAVNLTYQTDTNTLTADTFLGNLTGTVTGNIFTNLIDSADSSAIVITPITMFNSDVIVENDLLVTQQLIIKGSRVLNLSELQSLVAKSTDFASFKANIASLV